MNLSTEKINGSKSYATEANLVKAIESKGLDEFGCNYLVCCNEAGRYTAVFLVTSWTNNGGGGDVGFAAREGFLSV